MLESSDLVAYLSTTNHSQAAGLRRGDAAFEELVALVLRSRRAPLPFRGAEQQARATGSSDG